jgi:DNA adenine methylase
MTAPSNPVLRYHGGKFRIADWIISFFPNHKVYIEPFGGAASVLLTKARAKTEIYNDLDNSIVNLFKVLRNPARAELLAQALELTPFARTEHSLCYENTSDDIEQARRLIARGHMGQSSKGIWQKSGFDTRVNKDGHASRINALVNAPASVRDAAARLRGVLIENEDAITLIKRHDQANALFYCDPPYEHSTHKTRVYAHRMTEQQHIDLAEALHSVKGHVVLSGYPSTLYDLDLYSDWARFERPHIADGGKETTEVVWLNPVCSDALKTESAQLEIFDSVGVAA